jgi:uncharacterized membrane protein
MNTETLTPPAAKDGDRVPIGLTGAAHQAAVILTAVLAGALLATWVVEAALGNLTTLWIEYHQATTAAYTRALPPIGGLALIAALPALVGSRRNMHSCRQVLMAVGCLVAGLVVTLVVHFPINDAIATWNPAAPPADWQQLRDRWLVAHAVRTASVVAALGLLIMAGRRPQR